MFLVISAIASGCEGWQDIEFYGEEKLDWLRKYRPFEHGIPRRHTIARILRSVVAESLLEALALWINEQRTSHNKPIIAFDGKVWGPIVTTENCVAVGHRLRYRAWSSSEPEAD